MVCQRRGECVEPVSGANGIFQRPRWLDVLDPERNDRNPSVDGSVDFALDLRGLIRVLGKDQHHDATTLQCGDDRFAPVCAWMNISRGDPAADAPAFQPGAGRVGHGLVLGGVADENIMCHVEFRLRGDVHNARICAADKVLG